MTWRCKPTDSGDVHVVPENDLKPHDLSMRCWCRPVRDMVEDVVVHNAMDQRERYERGEILPQ